MSKIMSIWIPLLLSLISSLSVYSKLIRSNHVYGNVIKGVYNYYDCSAVILFNSQFENGNIQDTNEMAKLQELVFILSNNMILTTITSIPKFLTNSNIRRRLDNCLLVFLNDSLDSKNQLMKQLLPVINMSDSVWLFFLKDETNVENFFSDIYVPFNCRLMISKIDTESKNSEIITEIYRIERNKQLRYNTFGSWSSRAGMKVPKLYLYKRRNDLHGHLLRVTAIDSAPNTIVKLDEKNNIILTGIFGSVLKVLQQTLNFTTTYTLVDKYGSFKHGKWTGGMGTLVYNQSDIFPANLRIIKSRLEIIQFTVPVYPTRDVFFFKKPEKIITWNLPWRPFHVKVWIAILCVIILISTALDLISLYYQKKYSIMRFNRKIVKHSSAFLDVFGIFCNQAMPLSRINSIMILQYTTHITAVVILAAYSGILMSTIAVLTVEPPFKTLEALLHDETFRMGILGHSAYTDFFNNSVDKTIREIYKKKILREHSLPLSYIQGLEYVCKENKYAFLATYYSALQFHMENCDIIASEHVLLAIFAMGLQLKSPFRELINYQIGLLRENGILQKIFHDWIKKNPSENKFMFYSVDIIDVCPIFVCFFIITIISILFLWAEVKVHKILTKRKISEFSKVHLKKHCLPKKISKNQIIRRKSRLFKNKKLHKHL